MNPDTPVSVLNDVLNKIDLILIMSVYPGFAGQKFIPDVLDKVKFLRNKINNENRKIDIEIDGGIVFETAPLAIEAGANILVSGTTIFKDPKNIASSIEKLRNC